MNQNRKSRSVRRHARWRAINRKVRILKAVYYSNNEDLSILVEGALHKGKVHCSCKYCRYEQFYNIPKAREASKLKLMDLDVKEYMK